MLLEIEVCEKWPHTGRSKLIKIYMLHIAIISFFCRFPFCGNSPIIYSKRFFLTLNILPFANLEILFTLVKFIKEVWSSKLKKSINLA